MAAQTRSAPTRGQSLPPATAGESSAEATTGQLDEDEPVLSPPTPSAAIDRGAQEPTAPATPKLPEEGVASAPESATTTPQPAPSTQTLRVGSGELLLQSSTVHPAPVVPAPGNPASASPVDLTARFAEPIPVIDLPGIRLADALGLFAQLCAVPVNVDLDALCLLGIALDDPVTLHLTSTTVGETLTRALESRGLAYATPKGQILITGPDSLHSNLRPVSYTVSDLTGQDPASGPALADMVRRLVAPATWQGAGGKGHIEAAEGTLKVVQTDAVHRELVAFCERLRLARGLPLRSRVDPKRFTLQTRLDLARAKLDRKVSVNFYEPTPLERITSELEQIAETHVVINSLALAEEGKTAQSLTRLQVVDKTLAEALSLLVKPLGLAVWIADGSTVEITTPRAAAARSGIEFYSVGDLLAKGLSTSSLVDRVKKAVAGKAWSDSGGHGVLHFDEPSKTLIVRQSQDVQIAVQALLARLRAEAAPS